MEDAVLMPKLQLIPLVLLTLLLTLTLAACQQAGLPSPTPEPARQAAEPTTSAITPTTALPTAAPTPDTKPPTATPAILQEPQAGPEPTATETQAPPPEEPSPDLVIPDNTVNDPMAEPQDKGIAPRNPAELAQAMNEAIEQIAGGPDTATRDTVTAATTGPPPLPPAHRQPKGFQPQATPGATTFKDYQRSPTVITAEDPVSTFSLDADRASYQLALAWARQGHAVNPASVRAEEWINAFDYDYALPTDPNRFAIAIALTDHPLDSGKALARLSFQAPDLPETTDRLNVTLVIDASGSMAQGNRIEIARAAAHALRFSLRGTDHLAIVQFDSEVLNEYTVDYTYPSSLDLENSINRLEPGGSTNVQAGLNKGVQLAAAARADRPDALNYIILLSDGVANVDATSPFAILDQAELSPSGNPLRLITIGVGIANYNDYLLEQLAQHGNGWYRYLDSPQAAEDLFARDRWLALSGPFADNARAQITWDPEKVRSWRIIGYENRIVPDHQFDQNRREFAELPAGAAVTVFYEPELTPAAANGPLGQIALKWVDPRTGASRAQAASINPAAEPARDYAGDYRLWLDRLEFGAIVALAADRYSALSGPNRRGRETEPSRQAAADLKKLQQYLASHQDSPMAELKAWQDFDFLLGQLIQVLQTAEAGPYPRTEGQRKPNGYSR